MRVFSGGVETLSKERLQTETHGGEEAFGVEQQLNDWLQINTAGVQLSGEGSTCVTPGPEQSQCLLTSGQLCCELVRQLEGNS